MNRGIYILAVVLAVAVSGTLWGESASVLLEKGLYNEETVGNLEAAMQAYQQIIADAQANRQYVAQAHYRLGMCHLKKGDKEEAAKCFNQLVRNYSDQSELAVAAKAELAKLTSQRETLIVSFKAIPPFRPRNSKELLNAFNEKHPRGVRTHHYSTEKQAGMLVGHIHVDTQKGKELVVSMLNQSKKLGLVDVSMEPRKGAEFISPNPVVLNTTPGAFADDVDPSLKKITVTFDRRMMDGSWSWTGGGETFPKMDGRPYYDKAKTTCTMPVDLEPGKYYWVGINSPSHKNFKTPSRKPAPWYIIIFATKSADGKPTPIPEDRRDRALSINLASMGSRIDERGRIVDRTDWPFVDDPLVIGTWQSVDFVDQIELFKPGGKQWGGDLFLNEMVFDRNGQLTFRNDKVPQGHRGIWTKGLVISTSAQTAARYIIKHIEGSDYLFMEWKSGDYVIRHMRPKYYVLRKTVAGWTEYAPLRLNPAPWADGEVMQLNLTSKVGMKLGTIIYTAESVKSSGKEAWRIQSYMTIPMQNLRQFTSVDAERDSFAPMTGRTKGMMGDFKARYQPNKVLLDVERQGKKTSRQLSIEGIAYDNEQALYLIRRLPLTEGYEASFPIFPVQGGVVVQCRIKVTSKEKVKVDEQEIETYKVALSIYSQGVKALEHQLWFSTDASRRLVRYDSGAAIMELVKSGVKQKDEAEVFQDRELGISLSVPAGWYYYNDPTPGRYKFMLHLLPPEMRAWGLLTADAGAASLTSARQVAEGDIEILKSYFKNYKVRPKSWTNLKVSKLPAVSYAADYQEQAKDMVEYRCYVLGKSMVYWFVFRMEKDEFEAERAEFDSIITGLKTAEKPGKEVSRQAKQDSENLAAEGWKLWQGRELAEAEAKFTEAVGKDPSNANAWNGLGWSQVNQGKPLNGRHSFEKCLEINPEHPAALNGMGWIAKGQGNIQEALGYWEKAVAIPPAGTAALDGLAITYMELGDYGKAVKYYQMWIKLDPESKEAQEGLKKAKAGLKEKGAYRTVEEK